MASKINLPVRKFLEQKVSDNFQNIDFRRGTAFNDLVVNVMAVLQQPFRHELNMLKVNQSILNFDNMSKDDIDLLAANFFVTRSSGTKATGTVRVYFQTPGDYSLNTVVFLNAFGLRFISVAPVSTSVTNLLANRATDGTYFIDVLAQAEQPGPQYSVKAGDIAFVENQPAQIYRVENPNDFSKAVQTETNAVLYDKVRRSIAVRNLINDTSIKSVLFNNFGFIRDIYVAGAGDSAMVRDLFAVQGDPNQKIHTGGYTDVYIDTTGIQSYELNLKEVPESLLIDIIESAASATTFDSDTGVLSGFTFFDPFASFFKDGKPQVIRSNQLVITDTEFGQPVDTTYTIEQVGEDNKLRVTSGDKLNSLDGINWPNSNFFSDYIFGRFIDDVGAKVGDIFVNNRFNAHRINYLTNNLVEVVPANIIRQASAFNVPIARDGKSAVLGYQGIGGTGITLASVGDILSITSGLCWGDYTVLSVPDADTIWAAQDPVDTTLTFSGTNVIAAVPATDVGKVVILQSTQGANPGGTAFTIVDTTHVDRNHNITAASVPVWVAGAVPGKNISVGDIFDVHKVPLKDTIVTVALTSTLNTNAFFAVFNTAANVKRGDIYTNTSIVYSIIDVFDDGINLYAQFDKAFTGAPVSGSIGLGRYPSTVFTSTNIQFNRSVNSGTFLAPQTASATTIIENDIGRGAWANHMLVIHSGAATGTYVLASNLMNPNQIVLSTGLVGAVVAGDSWSIIQTDVANSVNFAGSAWGSTLYIPDFGGINLSAIASGFPTSQYPYTLNITNGPNKGVYEIVTFTSPNKIQINGSLVQQGKVILPASTTFTTSHIAGSTTITEPSSPFGQVKSGDTLVINNGGTKGYYAVLTASASTITIDRALSDSVIPGSQTYTIIRDALNPFIITSSQTQWNIQSVPTIYDRRAEGLTGGAANATAIFESLDVNFTQAFSGVDPAGYLLYILEGTHARVEPYIIQAVISPTQVQIDTVNTVHDASFNGSGFIGSTNPANSEKWEVKKLVSLLSDLNYKVKENYAYYGSDFFKLPILAIRDIYTINPTTGALASQPLVEGSDFSIVVKDTGLRYSVKEKNYLQILNSNLAFSSLRIRYYSDPNVRLVNEFCNTRGNKNTNNDLLVKRMESCFVDVYCDVKGTVSAQAAQDAINEYITTQRSTGNIEASDIIQKLYAGGATYVDTATFKLTSNYHTSAGLVVINNSPTIVNSGSTSTYIPGLITVNIIPS